MSIRQVSAGGVVFRKVDSKTLVCLVGRRRAGKLVWCLPKGHVEPGEDLSDTCLREVREETGISGSVVAPVHQIDYWFYDPETKQRIFKKVHFFLLCYGEGNLEDHDDEVECARWFELSEALVSAEYEGEREVLKKAEQKLKHL